MNVQSLTDKYTPINYPWLNRERRKFQESDRLSGITEICQTVKYADLIDNTSSILGYDPKFAEVYLKEKKEILKKMNNGDFDLYLECCHLVFEGLKEISEKK